MAQHWVGLCLLIGAAVAGLAKATPDILVFVHDNNVAGGKIGLAEGEAGKILGQAGIAVGWRYGTPHYKGNAKVIEVFLHNQTDPACRPGALAFTTLGANSNARIDVFADRIVEGHPEPMLVGVLGHVLAHEITHVLEGVARHSSQGLMKANWDEKDLERIGSGALPIAPYDLQLLGRWTNRHRAELTTAKPSGHAG